MVWQEFWAGTGMSFLFWLLSNMGNESLADFINVLPPIVKINGALYFNKSNNNFIVNNKNEFELHEKYTSLIDWKLSTNEITTYNEKVNIIRSIGLGVVDTTNNIVINNALDFSSKLLLATYTGVHNLTIDFFSSRQMLENYVKTLSCNADIFID